MIKPAAISEQLLFNTIRLETNSSVGTGFIFEFRTNDGKKLPVIVTNKHVVNHLKTLKVKFHLHIKENGLPSDKNISIEYNSNWIFHPKEEVDLCCAFFAPLLHQINKELSTEIFFRNITENLIWSEEKLNELSAVENVIMVGYPIGLFDAVNNLPLIRRGITASHPALDYNGKSIAVIDMSCFPGSSGSPIFIVDNGYIDKKGNMFLGRDRVVFLGVLFGGPEYNRAGQIEIKEVPTQHTMIVKNQIMINLGYYVKAKEIMMLKNEVESQIKK